MQRSDVEHPSDHPLTKHLFCEDLTFSFCSGCTLETSGGGVTDGVADVGRREFGVLLLDIGELRLIP